MKEANPHSRGAHSCEVVLCRQIALRPYLERNGNLPGASQRRYVGYCLVFPRLAHTAKGPLDTVELRWRKNILLRLELQTRSRTSFWFGLETLVQASLEPDRFDRISDLARSDGSVGAEGSRVDVDIRVGNVGKRERSLEG